LPLHMRPRKMHNPPDDQKRRQGAASIHVREGKYG
jgi:hypothetical protein